MYPREWEADIVARDGAILHIRPVTPADAAALRRLDSAQSDQSRFLRFFGYRGPLTDAELSRFTNLDHVAHVGLGVFRRDEMLAYGCFDKVDGTTAEVAFYVADQAQGRGLGSLLLDHLAAAGRQRDYLQFVAEVLPQNHRMLSVFADAGYHTVSRLDDGVVEVSIDLTTTQDSWRVLTQREHRAEALAMRGLMDPPRAVFVGDLPADWGVPRWSGEPLDGALVMVGELTTPDLIERLAAARAGAVVMLDEAAAGVLPAARRAALRLLGPYSYGIAHRWNLTWNRRLQLGGDIGVFTQSRRTSLTVLRRLDDLALHSAVCAGRRIDVSGNDVMQWWLDQDVRVAALALNSIGNPRKFARIGRNLASQRPVTCWVDTTTGQAAPAGHAVRTSPLPRAVLSGLLRQCGMIEADNVTQLADLTRLFEGLSAPVDGVAAIGSTQSATDTLRNAILAAGLQVDPDSPLALVLDEPIPREERLPGWDRHLEGRVVVGIGYRATVSVPEISQAIALVQRVCSFRYAADSELLVPAARLDEAAAEIRGRARVDVVLRAYGISCDEQAAPCGVPVRVSAVEDPLYGPVIAFGLSGDASQLFGDVAYRIAPLTHEDVHRMVREPRGAVMLPKSTGALERLIGAVAALKDDFPSVDHIELDPVYVTVDRAVVAGAELHVAPAQRTDARGRALSTPTITTESVTALDVGE